MYARLLSTFYDAVSGCKTAAMCFSAVWARNIYRPRFCSRLVSCCSQTPRQPTICAERVRRSVADIPLILASLAPYETRTLSVDSVLSLQGWTPRPQVIVLNNSVRTFGDPALNNAATLVPLLAKLSTVVTLPNMIVAGNIMDLPEDDVSRNGGPWFGFCNLMYQTTNLLYPAGDPVTERLICGRNCVPFGRQDKRENKAIFLGSSTGGMTGQRRTVVYAGMNHADRIVSGYTQLIDINQDSDDPVFNETNLKAAIPMADQVKHYKFIISADGHCATGRLRHLLASDSVVFWMVSDKVEWFYSLLIPYVHYVPIRYETNNAELTSEDIIAKLQWAEDHPAQAAAIVKNANEFAHFHLTQQGLQCYSIQLFDEYSRLFSDSFRLQQLANEGAFQDAVTHKRL